MIIIKEYQINVVGKMKGMDIPSGFRVGVVKILLEEDEATPTEYQYKMVVCSWEDAGHTVELINDDIANDMMVLPQGATLPTDTPVVAAALIEANLDTIYGSSNWAVV